MGRWIVPKSLRSAAVFAAGGLLLVALAGAAYGALNLCPGPGCGDPCTSDADCNCDSTQQAGGCTSQTGAGGDCVEAAGGVGVDLCICNPGYNPPTCASGACCHPNGTCTDEGQTSCEDGGTYQGDNVSCTAVTCPIACNLTEAPECDGNCPAGQVCSSILNQLGAQVAGAQPLGECECIAATETPTPTSTPTATLTSTPTATETGTPTNTPVMMGGPCQETADCEGGLFCEAGICTENTAPAPVASERGVLFIIILLSSVGAFAIFRRRRNV